MVPRHRPPRGCRAIIGDCSGLGGMLISKRSHEPGAFRQYITLQRRTVFSPSTHPYHIAKMCVAWERLIRFVADDGRTLYGEPILPSADFDIGDTDEKTLLRARVLQGQDIYDTTGATKLTDEIVTVQTLLGPLTPADVPVIRCIGLNYATHSKPVEESSGEATATLTRSKVREAGRKLPPYPSMFFKPPQTVTGHNDVVTIPKIAQNDQADYEGELVLSPPPFSFLISSA